MIPKRSSDSLAEMSWERLPRDARWVTLADELGAGGLWLLGWPGDFFEVEEVWPEGYDETVAEAAWDEINAARAQASYDPLKLEHGALFRQFADLGDSTDSYLEFAKKYGWLGVAEDIPAKQVDSSRATIHRVGERYETWVAAVSLMKLAVALATANSPDVAPKERKAARAVVAQEFGPHEEWSGRRVIFFPGNLGGKNAYVAIDPPSNGAYDADFRKRVLAALINHALSRGLAIQVSEVTGAPSVPTVVPDNLWRLMWYQLAENARGMADLMQCRACGTWRVRRPDVARGNARYCNGACKQKAYDGRKRRALKLHAERPKLTAKAIAKRIADEDGFEVTGESTVQRWIDTHT